MCPQPVHLFNSQRPHSMTSGQINRFQQRLSIYRVRHHEDIIVSTDDQLRVIISSKPEQHPCIIDLHIVTVQAQSLRRFDKRLVQKILSNVVQTSFPTYDVNRCLIFVQVKTILRLQLYLAHLVLSGGILAICQQESLSKCPEPADVRHCISQLGSIWRQQLSYQRCLADIFCNIVNPNSFIPGSNNLSIICGRIEVGSFKMKQVVTANIVVIIFDKVFQVNTQLFVLCKINYIQANQFNPISDYEGLTNAQQHYIQTFRGVQPQRTNRYVFWAPINS